MADNDNTYKSIGCSYYDQLEAYATQKTLCTIIHNVNGEETTTKGIIVDIFAKTGAEFLQTDTGTVIRLDHIVSVNGIPLHYAC